MPIGEMKISVNSQAAVNSTKALEDQYQKTFATMQRGMERSGKAAEQAGISWTELASKLSVAKTAISGVSAVFDKMQQSSKERGVLFSQFGENADIGAAKLMKYSAAVDYMINANALMRSSNALVNGDLKVSEDRFESVTKAAVEFARRSGEDVNTVLKTLTDSINAGTTRGLKPFGVQLDDTGTKAQKSERILAELHKRFKDIKITVGDAAEDMDKFKNKTKIMELVGGDAIERMVRKYQSMKLASAEWVADAFNVSTVQLYAQKMNEANDKILAGDKQVSEEFNKQIELQNKLVDVGRDSANNGQRRREIADEMVTSLDKQVAILKGNYDRQKLITDYARQTGEHYDAHKNRLDRIKSALDAATKKQAEWTAEATRTGGAIGKIFNLSIDYIKKGATATGKVIDNIDKEVKLRKKAADNYAKLSDEEKVNLKLKQIALGKNIELSDKELFILNKIDAKGNAYKEHQKSIEFNKKLTNKHLQTEADWMQKMTLQYELQGKYLNEKNRLERLYQEEAKKGKDADIFKLQAISSEMEGLKNKTEAMKNLNEQITNQRNVDYTNLIFSQEKQLQLSQLQEQRDLAIKMGKFDIASAIQKNIDLTYKDAEINAEANLRLKQKLETLNAFPAIYRQLSTDQGMALELQKAEIELAKAKLATDREAIILAAEKVNAIKGQQELAGQVALKMKEWENASYGAFQATKTMWQASGDALLMTDEQLKKSGKTRGQLMQEALKQSIMQIGKDNWFKGGTKFAEGLGAAANPVTATLAPRYFKAAAAHFGVAAAAGFASRALSGGGGGGSEGKNAAREAPKTQLSTTNQRNVTINISAGMVVNRDDMVRAIDSAQVDYARRWR